MALFVQKLMRTVSCVRRRSRGVSRCAVLLFTEGLSTFKNLFAPLSGPQQPPDRALSRQPVNPCTESQRSCGLVRLDS
jgi:hypothetical protein